MNEKTYVKPLYYFESNQKMMAVLPMSKSKSSVIIRIQHQEDQIIKKLSCKVRINQLTQLDLTAPAGTVLLQAVDVLSPERCQSMGYREDGCGYSRTLIVATEQDRLHLSIDCTLCERDQDGHICSTGDYEHTEAIRMLAKQANEFVKCLRNYQRGAEIERDQEESNRPVKQPYSRKQGGEKHGS